MILIGPENTKEGQWKRVPIHKDLLPILDEAMKVRSLKTDKLFLVEGRSPNPDSIKNPWNKAVGNVGLDPAPRFHDLRHTWKTNARRSEMDPEIREAIMGHGDRTRNVRERYGAISDQELIKAIDLMTFDHGQGTSKNCSLLQGIPRKSWFAIRKLLKNRLKSCLNEKLWKISGCRGN